MYVEGLKDVCVIDTRTKEYVGMCAAPEPVYAMKCARNRHTIVTGAGMGGLVSFIDMRKWKVVSSHSYATSCINDLAVCCYILYTMCMYGNDVCTGDR